MMSTAALNELKKKSPQNVRSVLHSLLSISMKTFKIPYVLVHLFLFQPVFAAVATFSRHGLNFFSSVSFSCYNVTYILKRVTAWHAVSIHIHIIIAFIFINFLSRFSSFSLFFFGLFVFAYSAFLSPFRLPVKSCFVCLCLLTDRIFG